MFLKILKYWVGGLIIFLLIIFIIPENSNFTDKKIFIDIPETNIKIKNNIYLYNKNSLILQEELYKYFYKNQEKKVSIIVPRLEYIIYYLSLKNLKKYNMNYELNGKTTKVNLQLIFFYYNKTLIKFFEYMYDSICKFISNIKGKK